MFIRAQDTASPLSTISLQGVKAIVEAPEEIFIPHSFAIRFADFDVEPYYLYADEQVRPPPCAGT